MTFKDPWFLFLLLLIPLLMFKNRLKPAAIHFSSNRFVKNFSKTRKVRMSKAMIYLRAAALALFIIALARPQEALTQMRVYKEGIDIVLALDTSTSMKALDFQIGAKRYDRLYVVKQVVEEFIRERENDRIAMIAFAARPYLACPLTLDHNWLFTNLERVQIGMVEDGTAIGSSITAALNRLRRSEAKTKIIILLTDGRNNAGKISPLTAAEAARALGVKIYTIGAGGIGPVPYPITDIFGRLAYQDMEIDIDESVLAKIADITDGRYFRATDTSSLKKIYSQINKLETTPFQQPIYRQYNEKFYIFLLLGLALVVAEQVLAGTMLIKIP